MSTIATNNHSLSFNSFLSPPPFSPLTHPILFHHFYACLRYAVVSADGEGEYPITSTVTAGADPQSTTLTPGSVAYITTGAPVPPGADAVVPVEDTELSADKVAVVIKRSVLSGKWIRPKGSDMSVGQKVLCKHELLSAADLGLLATVGCTGVNVFRAPTVGVLSTGDELVAPSAAVSGGKVRDSNRFMLLGAVSEAGGVPVDLGIQADQPQGIEDTIRTALASVDVLITSGGVSMGSLDLVKPLLEKIGKVHFGRLNMKPGKPTTFATVNIHGVQKLVFALPGNPVSSYVTFKLLAHPCILRLRGLPVTQCHHPRVHSRLAETLKLDPVRPEYHRAVLEWREGNGGGSGEFLAHSTGVQRSSRLLSVHAASALLCLPASSGTMPKGSMVPTLLLECHGGRPTVPPPQKVALHEDPCTAARVSAPSPSASTLSDSGGSSTAATMATTLSASSGCACCRAGNAHNAQEPEPEPPRMMGGSASAGGQHLKIGVLTVSDRASSGVYSDRGGPAILTFVSNTIKSSWEAEYCIVPDEQRLIESSICDFTDRLRCSIVITTGGTGPGLRDVTPEATQRIVDRELPGFGEQMRAISLEYVPTAILSRQTAGTRGQCLIVNLPGSPRSISQILPRIFEAMANCTSLIGGPTVVFAQQARTAAGAAAALDLASVTADSAAVDLPAAAEFTVDKANAEWLANISSQFGFADNSVIVEKVLFYVRAQDAEVVYEKVRGCNRKKIKQKIKLKLSAKDCEYLNLAAEKHSLPGIDKALRIVLDYALEDLAAAELPDVFG